VISLGLFFSLTEDKMKKNVEESTKRVIALILEDLAVGMTKRELFAAMAMQGYISTNNHDAITRCMDDDDYKYPSQVIAKLGVEAADALIKELGK